MDVQFPIYNVIVVGFHHKRGCQVEFAFPPLDTELENTAWKHLPTLAMPDGAHNFDRDTVYFHLPSLENPRETVFGVACYQQIDASKVKNKSEDVTRSTVQKSVCVLSRYPLYGHIQVKMSLITAAYFREGDFAQVSLLEEAYHNLNACLTAELLNTPEAFVGLSPRDLVFTFRHQILILFKLLLLERKVLFRGASVGPMCSALLTLISLLPHSVEYGLQESACVRTAKMYSIVPQFSHSEQDKDNQNLNSKSNSHLNLNSHAAGAGSTTANNAIPKTNTNQSVSVSNAVNAGNENALNGKSHADSGNIGDVETQVDNKIHANTLYSSSHLENESSSNANFPLSHLKKSGSVESEKSMELSSSMDSPLEKCEEVPDFLTAVQITAAEAGLPLQIFSNGYLCHPYLSLNYLDLLNDTRVKGFVVGATNILFKQKKDLVEVVVEMQDGTIDIQDPNLKRLCTLTTPDLRFAESIVKQVTQESARRYDGDTFMDGVGWEGGDEWIRAQFKYYLMCLMRTSLTEECTNGRQWDCFGSQYIQAWQGTENWKKWNRFVNSDERETPGIYSICAGHPNGGHISMSDMKIRLSHAIQNTESGRRLNQAVTSTGRAVAQTGKAVGGALHSAKGALSNWWGQVTTSTTSSASTTFSQNPIFSDGQPNQETETGTEESISNPSAISVSQNARDSNLPPSSSPSPRDSASTTQKLSQSTFHIDNID